MKQIFENDTLHWNTAKMGTRYQSNGYYEKLLAEFSGSEDFHKNTLATSYGLHENFLRGYLRTDTMTSQK